MKRNKCWHVIVIIVVILLLPTCLIFWWPDFINGETVAPDLRVLYALFSTAAAMILVYVAFINFRNIKHELAGSFLLEIDKRWSSKEILAARTLVHIVYREAEDEDANKEGQRNIKLLYAAVGKKLLHKYKHDPKQAMQLLNLLDLFESMGYFLKNEYIDEDQIEAFLGSSISFMWGVLEPIIEHRRKKRKDEKEEKTNNKEDNMYSCFEDLYKEMTRSPLHKSFSLNMGRVVLQISVR